MVLEDLHLFTHITQGCFIGTSIIPDNKVHVANMMPTWGGQDPGGPHVGPMNFAIRDLASMPME